MKVILSSFHGICVILLLYLKYVIGCNRKRQHGTRGSSKFRENSLRWPAVLTTRDDHPADPWFCYIPSFTAGYTYIHWCLLLNRQIYKEEGRTNNVSDDIHNNFCIVLFSKNILSETFFLFSYQTFQSCEMFRIWPKSPSKWPKVANTGIPSCRSVLSKSLLPYIQYYFAFYFSKLTQSVCQLGLLYSFTFLHTHITRHHLFTMNYIVGVDTQLGFYEFLYKMCLHSSAQGWTHSRCDNNICWMDGWMDKCNLTMQYCLFYYFTFYFSYIIPFRIKSIIMYILPKII